jgi:hypothetical protein
MMDALTEFLKPYVTMFPIGGWVLTTAGLAWGIYVWRRDNRRVLSVRQTGGYVENVVLALDGGLTTAIMLNTVITNDSPKTTIVIRHFDVELLWKDDEFDWLPDPAEMVPSGSSYTYSGTFLSYRRDMVLNHHRYEQGKLGPGDSIRGLLMGKSLASIPDDLLHGERVQMRLVVYDTKGKKYSAPFELRIDRTRGG